MENWWIDEFVNWWNDDEEEKMPVIDFWKIKTYPAITVRCAYDLKPSTTISWMCIIENYLIQLPLFWRGIVSSTPFTVVFRGLWFVVCGLSFVVCSLWFVVVVGCCCCLLTTVLDRLVSLLFWLTTVIEIWIWSR